MEELLGLLKVFNIQVDPQTLAVLPGVVIVVKVVKSIGDIPRKLKPFLAAGVCVLLIGLGMASSGAWNWLQFAVSGLVVSLAAVGFHATQKTLRDRREEDPRRR